MPPSASTSPRAPASPAPRAAPPRRRRRWLPPRWRDAGGTPSRH
ncbi:MAG: hypothetical protein ACLU37_02700 [Collinsella sp.]